MRRLAYVPITHTLPEIYQPFAPPDIRRIATRLYHSLVPKYAAVLSELRKFAGKGQIHKVYLDGLYAPLDFNPKLITIDPIYLILLGLVNSGAQVMPTEHPALIAVKHMLDIHAMQYGREIRYKSPGDFLKSDIGLAIKVLRPDFYYALERACDGEKNFNINRLRDRHVARNIEDTLLDRETGALLIGGRHEVDKRLKDLGSDIQVEIVNVF